MNKEEAQQFANEWMQAWNSHNIEAILSHYTEDFEIESPLAKKRFPESGGILKGKQAVRKYWNMGLERNPNLEFEIIDVLFGVRSLSIYYLSKSSNKRVIETMTFNDYGKVNRAIVVYS